MQTLGLAESTTRTESRLKSLLWPSIQSGADVDYLAVQGYWVCTIVGTISLLALVFGGQPIIGILVFLVFHVGGVGVREHNPFAATVTLLYYVLDFFAAPGFSIVRIIFTALLLSNLRATWIAGNWKPESDEAVLPARLSDTFFDKLADKWPSFIWPKVKVLYYIFSVAFLAVIVAGLIVSKIRGGPSQ